MINWYPGHMKKTKDRMLDKIGAVDLVIEIVDARIYETGANPLIKQIVNNKQFIKIYSKADLIPSDLRKSLEKENKLCANFKNPQELKRIKKYISEQTQELIERKRKKGLKNQKVVMMIVGVPNVGKSTLINLFAKKKKVLVGNKPGVTRSEQWINVDNQYELLDMPGILWPKIADQTLAYKFVICKSIKADIVNLETVVNYFYTNFLKTNSKFYDHYDISNDFNFNQILEKMHEKYENINDFYINVINEYENKTFGVFTLED